MVQWQEILSSDAETLKELGVQLSIHPLALEDCFHRDQRAKLEDYGNHQFLVWFLYTEKKIYELQFLIFPDRLILVTHDLPPNGESWRSFLNISDLERDLPHFVYHVLDRITDLTSVEIRGLFQRIQNFEQDLLKGKSRLPEILPIKKRLSMAELEIGHLGSVAQQLQNFFHPKDHLKWKLRDLHDHCERLYQSIVFHQSQVASAFEMHMAIESQKTNIQVKKLTLLAAIFVPLTFWTSFFGMNFQMIPFGSRDFFLMAMTLMFGSVIALYFVLRMKGYWK